jgi:hypothetical protein
MMWEEREHLPVQMLVIERMLAIYPSSSIAHFAHARWLMRSGDPAAACEALYRVVDKPRKANDITVEWLGSELEDYADFDPLVSTDVFAALIARIEARL